MNSKAKVRRNSDTSTAYAGENRRQSDKPHSQANNTWRPLQLLNLYRLLISGGYLALLVAENTHNIFNDVNTAPLVVISALYLVLTLLFTYSIQQKKPLFELQLLAQIFTDIIAITILAHFSGGFGNDIAILLGVSVAGGSVLSKGRNALLFAALASCAVLAESVYSNTSISGDSISYTHAGILGVTFFATAILTSLLAQRIRNSEALAEKRGSDLLTMEQLTRYIMQRLQTGVLVVDRDNQPRLMNDATKQLLDLEDDKPFNYLDQYKDLIKELKRWQYDNQCEPKPILVREGAAEIMPRFAKLGRQNENSGTLIFLEDNIALTQQAQQLKLASLGRLTASIAHEIRNPLGAISHAGQLLAESTEVHRNDKRLTEIISQQSKRLDKIVDNVMQLGQRNTIHSETINLNEWLEQIKYEFCQNMSIDEDYVQIINNTKPPMIFFDPSHLHQIVWNLLSNSLRHGRDNSDTTQIELRTLYENNEYMPILEVADHGSGVDKTLIDKIFEPFFTTSNSGTGLGLYICRELCANNHARLSYVAEDKQGACFRIHFADTRRQYQAA